MDHRSITVAELIDQVSFEKPSGKDYSIAKAYVRAATADTSDEMRFTILFELIHEANWSKNRLIAVAKHLATTLTYPWKASDWFNCTLGELHDRAWMLEQVHHNPSIVTELEAFEIEGKQYWRKRGGYPLPFTRLFPSPSQSARARATLAEAEMASPEGVRRIEEALNASARRKVMD